MRKVILKVFLHSTFTLITKINKRINQPSRWNDVYELIAAVGWQGIQGLAEINKSIH